MYALFPLLCWNYRHPWPAKERDKNPWPKTLLVFFPWKVLENEVYPLHPLPWNLVCKGPWQPEDSPVFVQFWVSDCTKFADKSWKSTGFRGHCPLTPSRGSTPSPCEGTMCPPNTLLIFRLFAQPLFSGLIIYCTVLCFWNHMVLQKDNFCVEITSFLYIVL